MTSGPRSSWWRGTEGLPRWALIKDENDDDDEGALIFLLSDDTLKNWRRACLAFWSLRAVWQNQSLPTLHLHLCCRCHYCHFFIYLLGLRIYYIIYPFVCIHFLLLQAYVRSPVISVSGGREGFDGFRIGLVSTLYFDQYFALYSELCTVVRTQYSVYFELCFLASSLFSSWFSVL